MTLDGASVLVVDDEPILSVTFGILLRREGAIVHVAANGEIALDILGREAVDIILCDKQMPVMDGMTLLRTMHDRTIRLPIVLFVNGIYQEQQAELDRLGVLATLTKPVMPDTLIRTLNELLLDRSRGERRPVS